MTNTLIILFSFIGIALLYYGYTKILNAPLNEHSDEGSLKRHLTVKELGVIEGGIKNLQEVIIIADIIEEPTNELYNSVKENFKKGVKYTFLISHDKYEKEKNSYAKVFQAIAEAIQHNYKLANLLSIQSLNFEWDDYPYIFYRYNEPVTNEPKAFAYMGTQLKEGIADEYELIPPTISLKILNLAFKGIEIPNYNPIRAEEVYNADPKIVPLYKTG